MPFYVTVTQGSDEGKTFRIEPGECVIGRSPSSTIVLEDESVAWEHFMLREGEGRLILHNLSAAGTRVRGRRVTEELKLASNDEIELSERCRVVVHQRLARGARRPSRRAAVLLAVVGLAIIGGAATWGLWPAPPAPRRVTEADWRRAFTQIESRLEEWVARRDLPQEALTVYRDAWRLEQALNPAAALAKWEQMRALCLTLPFPGGDARGKEMRIAEMAGTSSKALRVVMGWERESSSTDFRWNTDETYADALVWFVRRRAESCREHVEREGR